MMAALDYIVAIESDIFVPTLEETWQNSFKAINGIVPINDLVIRIHHCFLMTQIHLTCTQFNYVVECFSRYLGIKITISLDAWLLVNVIDRYKNGALSWDEVSQELKTGHADRMGSPTQWTEVPENPMHEDYFYSNPHECLPPVGKKTKIT